MDMSARRNDPDGPRVVGDITMSIDGFVTGPDAGPRQGLGEGGEPLHAWALDPTDADREVLRAATSATGAVVMGRGTFDVVDGPDGWSKDRGYGAGQAAAPPLFVVTGSRPSSIRLPDVTVVLEGPAAAVAAAREAAGDEDVYVMGGGHTVGSCLELGLLDVLVLHVSPIVLGAGTPLFDGVSRRPLRQVDVVVTPRATHVTYGVP